VEAQRIERRVSRMKSLRLILVLVFCGFFSISEALAEKFPYRSKYPSVQFINTEDLGPKYDAGEVLLVDVRSDIEYDVIHMVGAAHINLAKITFLQEFGDLAKKHPGKQFAFYCNGITCLKSYEAAERAMAAGHKNCFCYDGGIPEWAERFPKKTLLFGKSVSDPKKQLIPASEFERRCISFEEFREKAKGTNVMIFDLRDSIQDSGKLPGLDGVRQVPVDKFTANFVQKKMELDKTLLVFDQVGKQIEWVQYYLLEHGYQKYFFLKGGATAVLKDQKYK
jgi:rhodanese-related sulfurtransferase